MSITPPKPGSTSGQSSATEKVLQFPMVFPLKIMGRNIDGFADEVANIVQRHVPDFDPATLERRESRTNTYLSLTATFTAHSREQLDGLYRELTSHPGVSYVL